MTDQELRAMVRDSIARTIGGGQAPETWQVPEPSRAAFTLLPLPRGGDGDGLCIIEPSVRCTHCGYCQTYGH